jgi:predicted transcriptional regulator of viral defense system
MASWAPKSPKADKLPRLFELAAGQTGHFSVAQARELGYSARSLLYHVAAGHFERVSRGFYRLVGVPAGPHDDIVAAWLESAPRRAVVTHDTALALSSPTLPTSVSTPAWSSKRPRGHSPPVSSRRASFGGP